MPGNDDRINVRVPAQLKAEAAAYAEANNTTMSQLVIQLLTKLLAHAKRNKDADQI